VNGNLSSVVRRHVRPHVPFFHLSKTHSRNTSKDYFKNWGPFIIRDGRFRRSPSQCFPAQDGAAGLHALRPEGAVPQGNFNRGVWRGHAATNAAHAYCQVRERGQDGDGLWNLFRGFEAEGLGLQRFIAVFAAIPFHYDA